MVRCSAQTCLVVFFQIVILLPIYTGTLFWLTILNLEYILLFYVGLPNRVYNWKKTGAVYLVRELSGEGVAQTAAIEFLPVLKELAELHQFGHAHRLR